MDPKPTHQIINADEIKCSNCGHVDIGTFCSKCGTSLVKKRLTIAILTTSIIDFFYNIEDKYVNTFKALLRRPINFIINYLEGERDGYYIPFKYFFLNLGVNFFVISYFNLGSITEGSSDEELDSLVQLKSEIMFDTIINGYGNFFSLLIIPIFVLASMVLFPKSSHNTAEKATAITFLYGQLMVYQMILNLITAAFPAFLIINKGLVRGMEFGIIFILSYSFFNEKIFNSIWKSLTIIITIFLSLRFVLTFLQDILQWIYD